MTRAIMIQGAGSNVGKSMIVAGLARAYLRRGFQVRPFKPQNMSNNAAVTTDGGEIGRAQALQARACGVDPVIDMNPVLLKPESERGAQVIVQGKRTETLKARDYAKRKPGLMQAVVQSYRRVATGADLVLIEGAGSPAEINLRAGDIANMGFAEAVNAPVALVGDIDRGGVIAQIVGTHAILPTDDRDRIRAFAINKFRGDPELFTDGLLEIEARTGWPSLGVIPWFDDAWRLPAEDILDIRARGGGTMTIAVPQLRRIANFDDLDPLNAEPDVNVVLVKPGMPLPGNADLVLIPGTKTTIADLGFFRAQGWDIDLFAHVRRGGRVLGICGGYQMLGKKLIDSAGIEGDPCHVDGLGLLDVVTEITPQKRLSLSHAVDVASNAPVYGYEIHLGRTSGPDCDRAWLSLESRPEGAASEDGRILGCYLHGMFAGDAFRAVFLERMGSTSGLADFESGVETALDRLAGHLEECLDLDRLLDVSEPIRF